MADFPGIPGYKILSKLNTGGMAAVYLGIQEKLNRKVAIKILEPFLLKAKETAARFEQEAKTAASLSHSNIIQIHDTGKIDDYHYIVMEYLEESLRDKMNLNPKGTMHPEIALDIIDNLMNALDYAHFRGIYHRDIKPENIMFKQDSTPVLVDFGIARVFDSYDELTGTGICMGTVDYMSPEQCQFPETVDGRSDIYSLGVVLYEMLTGKRPYKGKSYLAVVLKHIDAPVPRLPHKLDRYQPLIDKMMEKDREKRISSGPEFNHLLDKILTDSLGPQPGTSEDSTTTVAAIPILKIDQPPSPPHPPPGYPDLKKPINKIKSIFKKSLDLIKINFAPDNELKEQNIDAQTVVLHTAETRQQLEQEKLNLARQYFEKALAIIKELEKTKDSPGLLTLENDANNQLDMIKKQLQQKEKDDQAYELAASENTIAAYRQYLVDFSAGGYVEKVREKLKKLKNAPQKPLKVKLRSQYKKLDQKNIEDMIKRYDFFDYILNDTGNFESEYEKKIINDQTLVIDHTTGLMWYDGEPPDKMTFKQAEEWVKNLDRQKYGGYDDWRFPTLEEAASLLRKDKNKQGLYMGPIFSGNITIIWTKDRFNSNGLAVILFHAGITETSPGDKKNQVRPVRSCEGGTTNI